VIEEKKKQNKSVSTLDCGGISSDKLYDACI
jgi:hypothetical protein